MNDGNEMHGGVNTVRRVGATVHRPATGATPTIHRFLRHLRTQGFDGVPAPLGFSANGDEVLSFLPGDVHTSLPPGLRTTGLLESAAVLLRRFHDAGATFPTGPDDQWNMPPRSSAEVICHGDVAPYNCVVRDRRVVGFFDFDTAHPAPRSWDVAYAVYRFAPLHAPSNPDGFGTPTEQGRRTAMFCDAYGLTPGTPLSETVIARLRWLIDYMHMRAEQGSTAFRIHIADGHADLYEADIEYIAAHRDTLFQAFGKA